MGRQYQDLHSEFSAHASRKLPDIFSAMLFCGAAYVYKLRATDVEYSLAGLTLVEPPWPASPHSILSQSWNIPLSHPR
jgi:hypothetical protein